METASAAPAPVLELHKVGKQFGTEPTFRPVEVVAAREVDGGGITVRAPDGFIFEGLDLDSAIRLRGMLD